MSDQRRPQGLRDDLVEPEISEQEGNDSVAQTVHQERISRLRVLNDEVIDLFLRLSDVSHRRYDLGEGRTMVVAPFQIDGVSWHMYVQLRDDDETGYVLEISGVIAGENLPAVPPQRLKMALNDLNRNEVFSRYIDESGDLRVEYIGHYHRTRPSVNLELIETLFGGVCEFVQELHAHLVELSLDVGAGRPAGSSLQA